MKTAKKFRCGTIRGDDVYYIRTADNRSVRINYYTLLRLITTDGSKGLDVILDKYASEED